MAFLDSGILGGSLKVGGASPLDGKAKWEGTFVNLQSSVPLDQCWEGMVVYVTDDKKHYKLTTKGVTSATNVWTEFGAGATQSFDDVLGVGNETNQTARFTDDDEYTAVNPEGVIVADDVTGSSIRLISDGIELKKETGAGEAKIVSYEEAGDTEHTLQAKSGTIAHLDDLEDYIKEPTTDGASGQVLTTDGSGGRSWTTVSGGGGGGDTNIIESISRNGTPITPDGNKNVDIPIFSSSGAGLVPARVSSEETTKFLREDGIWAIPAAPTTPNLTQVLTVGNTTTLDLITTGDITAQGVNTQTIIMEDGFIEDDNGVLYLKHSYSIDLSAPALKLNNQTFPSTAGTNGQVLTTDGTNMSWTTPSGGGTIYIELTKTQLDTAIANSELVPGTLYKITEVETWMKQGDTTKAIYLHAISTTELEKKGTGEFYVPKYNQGVTGYGIWSGELWIKTGGIMGTEPYYNKDEVVIWGGKHWKNLTGDYGTFIDHYELDGTNWSEIPVNDIDYNVRINIIEYDYANDMITYRKDEAGNEISTSYENWEYLEDEWFKGNNYNPIKVFQWGNEFDRVYVGVGSNIVENGVLACINQRGSIYNNALNNGRIYDNTIENNGAIHYNILNNGAIHYNILNNNGKIHDNTLNNGEIYYNVLVNNGAIRYNTLENNGQIRLGLELLKPIDDKQIQYLTVNTGDIGGALGIDLSSATLVYHTYERIVFKDSTGTTKIRYYDGSGNLVVADITD